MLSFWRKRSKTFVVHLVFWPIIAVFVIWGFEKADNQETGGAAAVVNDKSISMVEYRNALQRMIDFYSQMMQGQFDEKMQKQFRIRENTIQQLVNEILIAEQAEGMGIKVTDDEVRASILDMPFLKKDGRFSRENYEGLLRYYHLTAAQFEESIKKNSLHEKARRLFEQSVKASPAAIEKEKSLRSIKLNLEFVKLDHGLARQNIKFAEAELESFVKDPKNKQSIKEYYDLHKAEYSQAEEVRARHILIKAQKGNAEEERKAKEKLQAAQNELKTKTFDEVAKKFSDDPGSKMRGGELGYFGKGRMVPEFEKAAFAQPVGKVGDPVQTEYGFHIIKVEAKKAPETKSFEVAAKDIAQKLMSEKKVNADLAEIDKKMSSSPSEAASQMLKLSGKSSWEETGLFALSEDNIPKIGDSEEVTGIIMGLTDAKPFAPRLVKVNDMTYLFKLKKRENALDVDVDKIQKDLAQGAGRSTFMAWSTQVTEAAKTKGRIKINPQLLAE